MLPTNSLAAISGSRSGVLSSFIGVGTVTINMLLSLTHQYLMLILNF